MRGKNQENEDGKRGGEGVCSLLFPSVHAGKTRLDALCSSYLRSFLLSKSDYQRVRLIGRRKRKRKAAAALLSLLPLLLSLDGGSILPPMQVLFLFSVSPLLEEGRKRNRPAQRLFFPLSPNFYLSGNEVQRDRSGKKERREGGRDPLWGIRKEEGGVLFVLELDSFAPLLSRRRRRKSKGEIKAPRFPSPFASLPEKWGVKKKIPD